MKRYYRYRIDFDGKAVWLSGICMGIAVFLLAVCYLLVRELTEVGVVRQIFLLWLPVALCLTYIVLIRIVRWNAPGAFAILGAVMCAWLMITAIFAGGVGRIILAVLVYLLCGGVLILSAGGFLPGRLPATVCFAAVLAGRLLIFALGKVSGIAWLEELAALCVIAGLMLLPLGFQKIKKKELQ